MLAVHGPDELRRAVAAEDVKTLTTVPGIGQKGAQRIILELKDRIGAPGRPCASPRSRRCRSDGRWRGQVHAGLVGLGWSAKEADRAVDAVAPEAEPRPTTGEPDVAGAAAGGAARSLSTA